jgi:hypothetical protein
VRLGLWGPETAFANREQFISSIRQGGIAAMELVARDLKATGLYMARALSFAGVEYEILRHELTPAQIEIYDTYANAWSIIHRNMEKALELTGVVDGLENTTLNSGAKASARSRFESTKQRFFGQVLLSMKLPTVIAAVGEHLMAGQSVVLQLVTTAESILDRRLGMLSPDERVDLEIDLSPREYVMLSSTLHVFFAVAVYVERGGGRRRFPSVFHDFTPDNYGSVDLSKSKEPTCEQDHHCRFDYPAPGRRPAQSRRSSHRIPLLSVARREVRLCGSVWRGGPPFPALAGTAGIAIRTIDDQAVRRFEKHRCRCHRYSAQQRTIRRTLQRGSGASSASWKIKATSKSTTGSTICHGTSPTIPMRSIACNSPRDRRSPIDPRPSISRPGFALRDANGSISTTRSSTSTRA